MELNQALALGQSALIKGHKMTPLFDKLTTVLMFEQHKQMFTYTVYVIWFILHLYVDIVVNLGGSPVGTEPGLALGESVIKLLSRITRPPSLMRNTSLPLQTSIHTPDSPTVVSSHF